MNGTENIVLTHKGYISNYLVFDIRNISDSTFKWLQSNLVDKIINHVGLTLSESLKRREMPAGDTLLNKNKSSLIIKCVWNYKEAVGILSYIQVSTQTKISMAVHQCACF